MNEIICHCLIFIYFFSSSIVYFHFFFETDILPERYKLHDSEGFNLLYKSSMSERLPDFEITKVSRHGNYFWLLSLLYFDLLFVE
jgi:hypothetical protein